MQTWQRRSTRVAYENRWIRVREDEVVRPDGSEGIYGVIDKPDYALIIPLDGERVRLVEQFRYPIGLRRWEFPQGTAPDMAADMDPCELAVRELREETGLRAGRMTELGLLDVAAGMSSQRGRVFLATELTEGFHEREHEEQDMRSAWFPRATFEAMFSGGGAVRAWPERVRKTVAVASSVHNVLERVEVLATTGPATAWVIATNVYHRTAQGWRLVAHHASPGTTSEIQEVSDAPAILH